MGARLRGHGSTDIAAAIDVGSNAVRMTIARRDGRGGAREIFNQRAAIRLGHDVFSEGRVSEASLKALERSFRQFEAQIRRHHAGLVRAVATSALREAKNADAVVKRLQSCLRARLEVISGAEEGGLIRQAVQEKVNLSGSKSNLLVELGGGSAEISLVSRGELRFSEVLKLGAVRLLEVLGSGPAGERKFENLVTQDRGRVLQRLKEHLPRQKVDRLIGTGGNIEEIAQLSRLRRGDRKRSGEALVISRKEIDRVQREIESLSPQGRVDKLGLRRDRADVIEPAVLVYRELMRRLGLKEIWVPFATLRQGLLLHLFSRHLPGEFPEELRREIMATLEQYFKRFRVEQGHARQVCRLALSLFDQLRALHGLDGEHRLLLELAALLHDSGYHIAASAHHKHSHYLITSAMEFPGLDKLQVEKIALTARYHRRSHPKPEHRGYSELKPEDRLAVSKMAALLRLADSLDRAHQSRVMEVRAEEKGKVVELRFRGRGDLLLERWAMQKKAELFVEVFGRRVVWRTGKL